MASNNRWTDSERKILREGLSVYLSISSVAKILGRSYKGVLSEIQRGLKEEEYTEKAFGLYDPNRSIVNTVKSHIGEEDFKLLVEYIRKTKGEII